MLIDNYVYSEQNFNIDVTYPLNTLKKNKEDIINIAVSIANLYNINNFEMFIHNSKLFVTVEGKDSDITNFVSSLLSFPYFYYPNLY